MKFRFAVREDTPLILTSIDFYLSLGAERMSDWTVYRIAGDTLTKLAQPEN